MSTPTKKSSPPGLLRRAALVVLTSGAVLSIVFMLRAGRHNQSVILVTLFFVWVLSPFIGLFAAYSRARTWPANKLLILYCFMLLVGVVSVIAYSGKFNPGGMKTAAPFLIIPLVSWLLIVTAAAVIPVLLRKNKDGSN